MWEKITWEGGREGLGLDTEYTTPEKAAFCMAESQLSL